MEILQKYWYVALGALVLLFVLARRQSGGVSVQQIGGNTEAALAMAQLSSAERDADEQRKYGLIGSLLNYDLSKRQLLSSDSLQRIQLGQQIDLAQISADAQTRALQNQFALQSLAAQTQLQQYQQQAQLQQYALQTAYNSQRRNDWLGAITTGLQTLSPYIFSQSTSGGFNFPRTPSFNPNIGGGFSLGF